MDSTFKHSHLWVHSYHDQQVLDKEPVIKAAHGFGPLLPPALPWAGDCPEVLPIKPENHSLKTTPLDSRGKEAPFTALDDGQKTEPLVQVSTVRKVLTAVFKNHPWPLTPARRREQLDFNEEMVEHTHLLLDGQAERYRHHRVFSNTLLRLTHPEREAQFCTAVARSVTEEAPKLVPGGLLSRANLLQTPQLAVIVCSTIAAQIMTDLKPSVRFAKGTKEGDNTPYSINLPVKREASSDRPQTRLEMHVEKHRRDTLEELSTPVVEDREYWENHLFDLYTENGYLPMELQEVGETLGYFPRDFRRKRRSCGARLCGLFRRK